MHIMSNGKKKKRTFSGKILIFYMFKMEIKNYIK